MTILTKVDLSVDNVKVVVVVAVASKSKIQNSSSRQIEMKDKTQETN